MILSGANSYWHSLESFPIALLSFSGAVVRTENTRLLLANL